MTEEKKAKQPVTLYVVTAKTWEEHKNNSDDKVAMNYGVLRIFADKGDALAYMRSYYDDIEPSSKSISTYENGAGGFSVKIEAWTENIKDAVALSGHRLGDRLHHEVLTCRDMEVTDALDTDTMELGNDLFSEFYG